MINTADMKSTSRITIGNLIPLSPKTEIDGKVSDLSSKTIQELEELRDRQLKLVNNKAFITKLPDKGGKVSAFLNKIVEELKHKQEEVHTCRLLENVRLSGIDKQSVQNIEWEGKIDNRSSNTYLDSDDDSEPGDVLHILSQSTAQEKIIKTLPARQPLITNDDLIEIQELSHIKYIVNKTESTLVPRVTGNFKPFKTTKSNVHNPDKEILRKRHKHWEVTAATPPPIINGPAKILNLEESLKLQQDYNTHLKEVESKHAAEKLLTRTGIKMPDIPDNTSHFGKYREVDSEASDESDAEGSDKEVHDEEPERGGVVFTIMK